jgi:nucleoside-diphosphate-sugar epimerase
MKKIFVITGATGFIGKKIAEKLLLQNNHVIAISRNIRLAKGLKALRGAEFIQMDIFKEEGALNIPESSTLVHCAWDNVREVSLESHSKEYPLLHYNFIKQQIENGISKIFIAGSQAEYGIQYGPISPQSSTHPVTHYGKGKNELHKSLRKLQNLFNFDLAWSRFFYLYGQGQDPNTVMMQFETALNQGEEFFNMSHGEQLVDYLEIDEAADKSLDLILDLKDGVFNICNGKPISLRRLLEERMTLMNKNIKLNTGYYEYRGEYSMSMWGKE